MEKSAKLEPQQQGSVIALAVAGVAAFFSIYSMRPPAPLPDNAPPGEFSAIRALRHVRHVAAMPHPTGSPANAAARDYLVSAFHELGIDALVQEGVGIFQRGRVAQAAIVRNVVARLPGLQGSPAVLLVGHYDSVPTGPGAADDGHATGVLLETLRALRSSPQLRNDVIFLLTDGEEVDLLGADAFVREHPWAKDVGVVLNFEARGTSGPGHMFETSEGNGWLIRQFAQSAPYPRTDSLSYEVYRRLPNDSDLTVFKKRGYSGLNFAFIDDVFFYHTPLDDMAHLSAASVQQQGSNALALTRRFGNLDLSRTKAPDVVYFTLPFHAVAVYSQGWVWPLAILTLVALAALLMWGHARRRLALGGITVGVLALVLCAAAAALATAGLWTVIKQFHPLPSPLYEQPYNWRWYEAAFIGLTLTFLSVVYGRLRWRTRIENLAAGALVIWAVAMLLTCLGAPNVSYLFTWPLLLSLPAFGALIADRGLALWGSVAALAAMWIVLPYVDLFIVSLSVSMGWVSMALLVLLLGLLLPVWLFAAGRSTLLAAAGLCITSLAAAAVTTGFTPDHPKPVGVFYALNKATGQASWFSDATVPDAWLAQFIPDVGRRAPLTGFASWAFPFAQAAAPPVSLPAPQAEITDDRISNGVRTVTLRLRSVRQAPGLLLVAMPWIDVSAFSVEGRPLPDFRAPSLQPDRSNRNLARLAYLGFSDAPPEGITCVFSVAPRNMWRLRIVDVSPGLPGSYRPRPPGLIPSIFSWPYNESTLVGDNFTIPPR
jgi:hypothetical protein